MWELIRELLFGTGEVNQAIAWFIPMIAGAATSMMGNKQKQEQYKRDTKLASETQRYSPWTGLTAQRPQAPPSQMQAALKGGAAGFGMGQSAFGGAMGVGQLGGGGQQGAPSQSQFAGVPQLANAAPSLRAAGGLGGKYSGGFGDAQQKRNPWMTAGGY